MTNEEILEGEIIEVLHTLLVSHGVSTINGKAFRRSLGEIVDAVDDIKDLNDSDKHRDSIPIGSIRRLLNWTKYSINGHGKPYTDSDGLADIRAVESWTDKF